MDTLTEKGWLLKLNYSEDEGNAPFYTFWTYFNFKKVQWSAIPSTFSSMFSLILYGILNVSTNVTSLSLSLNMEIDINKELCIHGYTNMLV